MALACAYEYFISLAAPSSCMLYALLYLCKGLPDRACVCGACKCRTASDCICISVCVCVCVYVSADSSARVT